MILSKNGAHDSLPLDNADKKNAYRSGKYLRSMKSWRAHGYVSSRIAAEIRGIFEARRSRIIPG